MREPYGIERSERNVEVIGSLKIEPRSLKMTKQSTLNLALWTSRQHVRLLAEGITLWNNRVFDASTITRGTLKKNVRRRCCSHCHRRKKKKKGMVDPRLESLRVALYLRTRADRGKAPTGVPGPT